MSPPKQFAQHALGRVRKVGVRKVGRVRNVRGEVIDVFYEFRLTGVLGGAAAQTRMSLGIAPRFPRVTSFYLRLH